MDHRKLKLESRRLATLLEDNLGSALYTTPKPIFQTKYLSNNDDNGTSSSSSAIRINRDQDGSVLCYCKISDSTEPTDYSHVMPDLGVAKLLEGFNDAITKFYL